LPEGAPLLKSLGEKWRRFWEERKVFEANPDPEKPKMFITAAYPYPNAPLHLGHALTYTIPDVIAKYKKMKGFNVLFPMGFHFTGTPVLVIAEALSRGDPQLVEQFVKLYGVPPEDLDKLKDPLAVATYFKKWAEEDLKALLLGIDWRRSFTTVDPEYSKFIEWQFEKLRKKGLIVRGTHPVGWCPKHQSPVSMHDTIDDVEPEIAEFTLIFFEEEGGSFALPAATLRPETVLGVTNVWVNPEARYALALVDGKKLIVSLEALYKLSFQKKHVEKLAELSGKELVEKRVKNPLTKSFVYVLGAKFVDPSTGTGVVMSVPAHAPYDYVALAEAAEGEGWEAEVARSLKPVPLIRVPGYSEVPARDAVERFGASSTSDKKALDEATKKLYLDEHEKGVFRDDVDELVADPEAAEFVKKEVAGKPVSEARAKVAAWLREKGLADSMYEIANKPVYCRCGTEVVVKLLEGQWFIDYENPKWKEAARAAFEKIEVVPEEYRQQFYNTIDWLKKKACARSRGLGTRLPWDRSWVIESLSDSTIYMAFYTVAHKIRSYGLKPEQLTEEFWDYVFLGEGDPSSLEIPREVLEDLRSEFLYWYPLDNRHSGKDLVQNHLTFMVFNHVAIFPEGLWPRRVVVNGHVLVEGEKMSKSKGNFVPLRRALAEVGPDALRLALIMAAEVGKDANVTKELLDSTSRRLERIYELVSSIASSEGGSGEPEDFFDEVLSSKAWQRIEEAGRSLESYKLRQAAVAIFSLLESDVREYLELKPKPNWALLRKVASAWVRAMAPFTPALAEELWHKLGGEGSVFEARWPEEGELPHSPRALLAYALAELVASDVSNILRASKKRARRAAVVAVSPEKARALAELAEAASRGAKPSDLARIAAERWRAKKPLEAATEALERLSSLPEAARELLLRGETSEASLLEEARRLLEKKLGMEVLVAEEGSLRAEAARREPLPLKPSVTLYFE